ncbi:energy transducer TonB [Chitinophaga horti]|uniref:Energy transducer TonB n=1 Tax=Chitinophaga horti TaxID=2920382 RepID=A0ABY6J8Z3_9BACT|nr:energy transducer TonB [Chitinophaga horti]UYQ94751.1 energy transducer TonB [Chitinophaga horti]
MKEQTQQKNTKAAIVTIVVHAAIIAILLVIPLSQPAAPLPNQELGMEVNLGTSDDGMGEEQPLNPNPPAASAPVQTPQSAPVVQTTEQGNTEELATQTDEDAPEVPAPPKPTPPKETPKTLMPKPEKAKPKPVAEAPKPTPAPPAPKPKAIFSSSGTNTAANAGNGANGSNNSNGEGNTGKPGDRGKINGDPNAKGYDGDGGTGNTRGASSLRLSGRSLVHAPSLTYNSRESGYVAVDIKIDRNGNVLGATLNPKRSTLTNSALVQIALEAAKQLKYSANPEAAEVQYGPIRFYFKGQ